MTNTILFININPCRFPSEIAYSKCSFMRTINLLIRTLWAHERAFQYKSSALSTMPQLPPGFSLQSLAHTSK